MASSFQKVSKHKENQIRGTKVSVQNAQLLTSTGIPNLDYYLGGGVPLGTICLIEEGSDTAYSNLIVKYFLAEGVACNHSLFLYCSEIASEDIIKTLPGISSDNAKRTSHQSAVEPLKIAWRYQDLPVKQQSDQGLGQETHSFCLNQPMDEKLVKECNILMYDISDSLRENTSPYHDLMAKLVPEIKRFSAKDPPPNGSLLRIVINGLGGPLWESNSESISKFLHAIRCLARFSYAVFLVTIPTILYHELGCLNKIRLFVDYSIELEPLAKVEGQENHAYKDYHGLFHVHKRSSINSVAPFVTSTSDLVFKVTRKAFVIEKLHLPPDLSETVNRSTEDPKITKERLKTLACGAPSGLNKLDF